MSLTVIDLIIPQDDELEKNYFPSKDTLLLTLALKIGIGQILGFAIL